MSSNRDRSLDPFIYRLSVEFTVKVHILENRTNKRLLIVFLAIMYLAGLRKTKTVVLSHRILKKFGIRRQSLKERLEILAEAGVLSFEIEKGRAPRGTLLLSS